MLKPLERREIYEELLSDLITSNREHFMGYDDWSMCWWITSKYPHLSMYDFPELIIPELGVSLFYYPSHDRDSRIDHVKEAIRDVDRLYQKPESRRYLRTVSEVLSITNSFKLIVTS